MDSVPRFSQSLEAYVAHRPAYPDQLFGLIRKVVPLDRRMRAVDLGAGTGLSALPLCGWFRDVIAVEPDEKMAGVIREQSAKVSVHTVQAEEFIAAPGSVDLVTCGTSFHWMDGPRVLANAVRWLRPRGILAIYTYWFPRPRGPADDLIQRELHTHWDAFRHDRLRDTAYSRRTFESCAELEPIEKHEIPNVVDASVEWLLGFLCSTSYVAAYLKSLADAETYWKEFEFEMRRAAPSGQIEVDLSLELFLARKREASIEMRR
jgi:SAM-dependent methyltransferase